MDPIDVIKSVIAKKDLKKKAVAEALGMTPQQFSDMLNHRRTLKCNDIAKICEVLEIEPNELYGYTKSA